MTSSAGGEFLYDVLEMAIAGLKLADFGVAAGFTACLAALCQGVFNFIDDFFNSHNVYFLSAMLNTLRKPEPSDSYIFHLCLKFSICGLYVGRAYSYPAVWYEK